jgi:hypothetical protein
MCALAPVPGRAFRPVPGPRSRYLRPEDGPQSAAEDRMLVREAENKLAPKLKRTRAIARTNYQDLNTDKVVLC